MALTYAKLPDGEDRVGRRAFQYWDVTMDSSYPTGGETISPSKIGLKIIEGVSVIAHNTAAAGYVASWNKQTGKLQVFTSAAQAAHTHNLLIIGGQAAAGTDTVQAAVGDAILGKEEAANATIVGTDSATKGGVVAGAAVAAAALAEVANATNLSTLQFRILFIGK